MKSIFTGSLIALLFLNIQHSFSKILTVSNNPNNPAQYTKLQDALNAASANDTVYVSGSENQYTNTDFPYVISITKPVTLIGAGYNPNKELSYSSKLQGITFGEASTTVNSSNSHITGFEINGSIGVNVNTNPLKNIIIERCQISGISLNNTDGWVIKNNILTGQVSSSSSIPTNLLICNNIFNNNGGIYTNDNSGNIIVTNNLFLSRNSISTIKNTTFNNNIFYFFSPYNNSVYSLNNEFNNNLVYGSSNDNFYLDNNSKASGNIIGQEPQFVNAAEPPTFGSVDVKTILTYDYHLSSGSPGHNAGNDGLDIGIYGGPYPFPVGGLAPYITSPGPTLPQITSMNIINQTIPQNGTLKVNVKGKIQE